MIGSRLAHFEIVAQLGAGGMGVVYRARDTRLGREVAIKVLPEAFVADRERLVRFGREARLLASLNHPAIAGIHEVGEQGGTHFLVMELAEGETLAERLARGPVPVDEALEIALQIAEALEAAHERGIVHRDLKPANVKLADDGTVKLLDFGLAKALGIDPASSAGAELGDSPTLTYEPTRGGVLLGTAAYMSPEQARGRPIDKRTDIWAFGVVLWEMLTGRRLFAGETVSDVLAAVLRGSPPPDVLPSGVPPRVRALLDRCLVRDERMRLRDIGEARIALTGGADEEPVGPVGSEQRAGFGPGALVAVALGASLFAAALLLSLRSDPAPSPVPPAVSFSFDLPSGFRLSPTIQGRAPIELAPDGSFVVFAAQPPDGESRLFRRSAESVAITELEGTVGGQYPFVSPDGEWIGFYTAEGGLARVPAAGGLPQRVFDRARLLPSGAMWGPGDRIFFPRGLTGGLGVVSSTGRDFASLTAPDTEAGEVGHWHPELLPDGRHLLFAALTAEGWSNQILDLDEGDLELLGALGGHLQFVDTGHLVWLRGRELVAAPFEPGSRRFLGEAETMLSGVSAFHVTRRGTLAYLTQPFAQPSGVPVRWSPDGDERTVLEAAGLAVQVRVSPDGRRLAIVSSLQLWIFELERGTTTRLSVEGVFSNFPVWSPDGAALLFNSVRNPHGLYLRSADGLGEARLVLEREGEAVYFPASWDPNGGTVAVTELHPDGQADVALVRLDSGEIEALVATEAREHSPAFSPDGRWLAYASNESGRDEIYVRPYPEDGERLTISTDGGTDPRWSPDGRSLLYRRGPTIFEVAMDREDEGARLEPGRPRHRQELPSLIESFAPYAPTWDVAPNGDLVSLATPAELPDSVTISVVYGWSRALRASSK